MQNYLSKDRVSCYTQVGVHKDDIIFKMNDYPIKNGFTGAAEVFSYRIKISTI